MTFCKDDRVKVLQTSMIHGGSTKYVGQEAVVENYNYPGYCQLEHGECYRIRFDDDTSWNIGASVLSLVGDAQKVLGTTHTLNEEITPMGAIQILKNAKLTADDRFLQAECLEDSEGTVMSGGRDLLMQQLWEEHKTAIAKELRAAKKTIANERRAYELSISADVTKED